MTAIESDTNSLAYWQTQGCVLCTAENYLEALAAFNRALAISPKDCRTWNYKGNALSALSRQAEALACYDQAVFLNLRYHQAWFNRGLLLAEMGAYGSAIESYNRAINLSPDPRYFHAQANIWIKKKLVPFLFN